MKNLLALSLLVFSTLSYAQQSVDAKGPEFVPEGAKHEQFNIMSCYVPDWHGGCMATGPTFSMNIEKTIDSYANGTEVHKLWSTLMSNSGFAPWAIGSDRANINLIREDGDCKAVITQYYEKDRKLNGLELVVDFNKLISGGKTPIYEGNWEIDLSMIRGGDDYDEKVKCYIHGEKFLKYFENCRKK